MNTLSLFDKPKVIGLIGDVNTGKSNAIYHFYEELKKVGKFNVVTFGLKNVLENALEINSLEELEKIKNSIVFIDEMMTLFDLDDRKQKRNIENTLRLIAHNNNILVLCALPENIKKFLSSKLSVLIFKRCTIADFINGSTIKRKIIVYNGVKKGTSILDLDIDECLIYDGEHYHLIKIPYYEKYDSKKDKLSIVTPLVKVDKKK